MKYLNPPDKTHFSTIGILLTNLGTPDAPTPQAVRRYLGEFLADPRITETPRWLWWFILHGIILRSRPRRVAHSYAQIWTPSGSPLLTISQAQQRGLNDELKSRKFPPFKIVLGMRYGNPSLQSALTELYQAGIQRLLILPLYPQYSSATTGSTFEAVSHIVAQWRWIPEIKFVAHYHDHSAYIGAMVAQIRSYWAIQGQPTILLFSFHGIPKRFAFAGDPYSRHCLTTAKLIAEKLQLSEEQWQIVFQSRFGREEWLKPYTDHTLIALGKAGTARVDVVCPGFATDCLETLEEINQLNRHLFLEAGGREFHYIPALNATLTHIQALATLIVEKM